MYSIVAKRDEEGSNYVILINDKAVVEYVYLMIPELTSPVKTIKSWRNYISELRESFTKPLGEVITKADICSIMVYLNEKNNFSHFVNPYLLPVYSIINNTNIYSKNECVGMNTHKGWINECFLYNLNEREMSSEYELKKTIAIFFHELGHTLYYFYEKEEGVFPYELIEFLKDLAPDIACRTYEEQCVVIADTFAMGMMKDSPFEKYDVFPPRPKMKEIFSKLVDIVVAEISVDYIMQ